MKNIKKYLTFTRRQKQIYLIIVIVAGLVLHFFVFVLRDGRSTVLLRGEAVAQDNMSQEELEQRVIAQSSTLLLEGMGSQQEVDLAEIGITLDQASVIAHIDSAHSWQHMVPVWGTWKLTRSVNLLPTYSIDKEVLTQAALELSQQLTSEPVDARLEIRDGQISVVPEQMGSRYASQELYDSVFSVFSGAGTGSIQLQAIEQKPVLSAGDLDGIAQKYAGISSQELTVTVDDVTFVLSPAEILELIDVSNETVALNQIRVDELVAEWSQQVARSAGITQVEYIDDKEVSRSVGSSGVQLPAESVVHMLESWLADPSVVALEVETEIVAPKVVESRSYSASSAGLQAALDAWQGQHSGTYRVAVQELGGQGRQASINASSQTVMASTYKVFLSVVAYSLIENGQLAATTIIDSGKNVEQCIKGGIVDSENTCMVALGWHIGWDTVDEALSDMGFQNISLNNYSSDGSYNGDKVAPAQELAKLLKQLADSSIISTTHTNSLLGYMKQQVYRDGIPAGSSGSVVANKVGFLYAYIHDMGIVYAPNSTYALVIMTENADWAAIADLSSTIYEVMNTQ